MTLDDIARTLQGYDPQALKMEDANAFIAKLVSPVQGVETLALRQCAGRVLAQDVVSPISVPAHDNSAMDGFAFSGALLQAGVPLALRVVGTALAGKAWVGTVFTWRTMSRQRGSRSINSAATCGSAPMLAPSTTRSKSVPTSNCKLRAQRWSQSASKVRPSACSAAPSCSCV